MLITDKLTGEEKNVYTKKIMRILTQDGRSIERNITHAPRIPPGFSTPADDQIYATVCLTICTSGFTDTEKTNAGCYTHIGPANIKEVSISFE